MRYEHGHRSVRGGRRAGLGGEVLEELVLGLRVEGRGGFVQDEQERIAAELGSGMSNVSGSTAPRSSGTALIFRGPG
ncbi:hypothetical protein ACTWPT_07485 [Nonomuraea sp. 3N208]|uniref:hypothetical protein n=1 Tax=Nonomuraea sp. 3N208 TaxID=3457421 RepID=UPI003FCD4C8E